MEQLKREDFVILGIQSDKDEAIKRPNITFWQDAWRRLKKNKLAMISLITLIFIILMSIVWPMITTKDFYSVNTDVKNLPISSEFWFGTDLLGRDLFARVWMGGRISMAIAVCAAFVQIVIGSLYGGIMAYFGGLVDEIMMRVIEIFSSIPYLLVAMLIVTVLGKGIVPLFIALCITAWTGTARMIRGVIMQLRESEFVLASQALGASPMRVIVKHLLPNTLGLIILQTSTSIPSYIFDEAALGFLGLGVQPPDISWGQLIDFGRETFSFYPHQLIIPAATLCITVLCFNLLGEGLRDALDPKLRK
ncbi:MAG: ABC transporter permease [Clostridium sp.]